MYTHMYKFKPFPILFDLEQLSAFVLAFGKQECRDMDVHIYKTEGFLVKVSMCLCICMCSKTRGHMKPKFMWNHTRIGEES